MQPLSLRKVFARDCTVCYAVDMNNNQNPQIITSVPGIVRKAEAAAPAPVLSQAALGTFRHRFLIAR